MFATLYACVAGFVAPASATPRLDLIVKDPDSTAVRLIRPDSSKRVSADYLVPSPLVRTGKVPLEVWAHREGPDGTVVTDSVDRSTGQPVTTPIGLKASMDYGLGDLIHIRIVRGNGRVVRDWTEAFCPNGYGGAETSGGQSNSGPTPVYPWSIYPYGTCGEQQADSLVWFVGRGSPAYYIGTRAVGLPDGRYTLVLTLNQKRALPEKSFDNNQLTRKFTLTTDRKLWRNITGAPQRGSGRYAGSGSSGRARPSVVISPGNQDQKIRPPRVSDIDGPDGALPDPAALPASKFEFDRWNGKDLISFSSIVSNAGDAPIALFGKRTETESRTMPGWQYLKGAGGELVRRPTNGFVWDSRDTHRHWHYNRLAAYELLAMDGTVLKESSKIGFCFMPTTALHIEPVPGAFGSAFPLGSFEGPLRVNCGSRDSKRVAMSLQAGWGDEYYQGIAGQSFNVSNLPAGSYRLRITVNPKGDLAEVTADNNVSERLITLGSDGNGRTLSVPGQGFISSEFQKIQKVRGSGRASVSGFRPTAGFAAGRSLLLCGLYRY